MNRREFFMLTFTAGLGAFGLGHRTDKLPPITVPAPKPGPLPPYMYASDEKPGLGIWQLQQWPPGEASQQAMFAAACCK